MSWGTPDVYYQPEEFGLKPVGEIEPAGLSYEFDIFAVWKDEEGNYYWGTDSGCSCPSPFESFTSVEELSKGTKHDVISAAEEWKAGEYSTVTDSDWAQFVETVMNS